MKLTKFQQRVADLMDKGLTRSRDIADALGSRGPCSETNVSKAMCAIDDYTNLNLYRIELQQRRAHDDRIVHILTRLRHRCLSKNCFVHGAYDPANVRLAENIIGSGRLLPEPTPKAAGDLPDLTGYLTKKEARVLMTLLRYADNEPSDEDYTEFQSLKIKFERALPNI